jgi:AraC-like DNA-binding protein
VQELTHVIYRSPLVSICELTCRAAFGSAEFCLGDCSLVFVRSGLFEGRIGGRTHVVDANYAVFGSEGDALSPAQTSRTACTFTAIRYCGLRAAAAPASSRVALCGPAAYLMHARVVNAARLARGESVLDDVAVALLDEALGDARTAYTASDEHARIVGAIKELLNQSLSKPISLLDLADRFYLSPFTISRCFHKATGVSLRQYMHRLRLRRALSFMLDEKRSLTAIALELGFYDESHFSKAFHAEFGTPPALALKASANMPPNRPSAEWSNPD